MTASNGGRSIQVTTCWQRCGSWIPSEVKWVYWDWKHSLEAWKQSSTGERRPGWLVEMRSQSSLNEDQGNGSWWGETKDAKGNDRWLKL